jgi:hypothetical protein
MQFPGMKYDLLLAVIQGDYEVTCSKKKTRNIRCVYENEIS